MKIRNGTARVPQGKYEAVGLKYFNAFIVPVWKQAFSDLIIFEIGASANQISRAHLDRPI